MKNLLAGIFLLVTPFSLIAQTAITVIIKTNVKIDSVSIVDISQQEFHNLPYKDTLTFNFHKNNVDCYNIRCDVKGKIYWKQVWLNNGNVTVKAHLNGASELVIDTVLNSPVFYSVIEYFKQSANFGKDTTAYNNFMLNQIEKNLENPRSIAIADSYINFNQNSKNNLLKVKQVLARQKSDFSWFLFYDTGVRRINKLLKIKNLKLADFKFTDRKGRKAEIKLKNYNYYLLDFWFVGCVPCMQQHRIIKSQLKNLESQKVKVIGIGTDKDFDQWNHYLSKNGYLWNNYLQAGKATLTDYLGIKAFPAYVLLNSEGEILSTFGSLNDALESLKIN